MSESKLKKYNSKRNFDITSEPEGRVGRSNRRKLKFSVQHHLARADHYDLRLELGGVALSWAVPKGPSFCTADKRLAMRVEDHPIDYMDFEGTIPKGEYGGGTVMLWDEGEWTPHVDPEKGIKEGSLKFNLNGQRLKGDWALVKIKNSDGGEPWLLIKERDGYAKNTAGISRFTRGVRSGKSMAEIAKSAASNPFKQTDVMLAKLCETLPTGKGWIYELKYDGHRTLGFCEGGKTTLYTRNGHNCTSSFSVAAEALSKMLNGRAAVVDGEMVVAGEGGIPDFGALQAYIKNKSTGGLNYVIFDLLALDGEDLRELPLIERKQKLKALLKNAPYVLSYSEHTERMTKKDIEAVKNRGMEGIVAKRANAAYVAGKNGDWQKLKFRNAREFVIGGYTLSEVGELRSLLVGFYEDGKLSFAGRVGTGFTDESRRELKKRLAALKRKTPPFSSVPQEFQADTVWVKPALAAQVDFAEITSAGLLRQASFKGIRSDKEVKEIDSERPKAVKKSQSVKKEDVQVCGIKITHPEKAMFSDPTVTKSELAKYYAAASERMLPYIKDRFLSLVCCPAGIDGEKFFRRHLEGNFVGIKNAPAEDAEYFYAASDKGIINSVQYNAVEFHVWGSKKNSPYRPDIMIFDLDPDEELSLGDVRRGVRELKYVLDGLGLKSFLKTSGGKGYHVVVPFKSGIEGQAFRDFSKRVAQLMEEAYPNRYTSTMSKKVREGKIFIDWQRNSPGATSVAPYSVRARKGAPVSMPIAWEELSKVAPNSVDIRSALRRLQKPDPWADFFKVKSTQTLKV
ncbi:MAG: DNA ligase D [Clostridiales bacterium]|nr:DNA ligase D [Clostridiales bacterium]